MDAKIMVTFNLTFPSGTSMEAAKECIDEMVADLKNDPDFLDGESEPFAEGELHISTDVQPVYPDNIQ